jgi:nitrogenase molybdenum-iron protein alpha/beta subunit
MKIIDKGIPQATDYFGVLWTLAGIKDCIIVEHGAPGTVTYTQMSFNSMNRRSMFHKIFTSAVNENDVIMGSDARLAEAVKWVDSTYHPSIIAVVATAITAVIGLDIDGFVRSLRSEVSARLISFPSGGFHGTYLLGIEESSKSLIRELLIPDFDNTGDRSVNILGPTCEQFNTVSDITEIRRLLKLLGISIGTIFADGCTTDEIKKIPAASLNLVIRDVMIPVGSLIEEISNQKFFYGLPMGLKGTINWLSVISEIFGIPYPEEVVAEEVSWWGFALSSLFSKIQEYDHLSVALACPYEYAYGLSELVINDWGMNISAVFLPEIPNTKDYLTRFSELGIANVYINPDDELFSSIITQKKTDILFGNSYYLKMAKTVPIKVHASHPTPDILTLFDGTPFVGFRGYAYLTQMIVNQCQAHPEVFRK